MDLQWRDYVERGVVEAAFGVRPADARAAGVQLGLDWLWAPNLVEADGWEDMGEGCFRPPPEDDRAWRRIAMPLTPEWKGLEDTASQAAADKGGDGATGASDRPDRAALERARIALEAWREHWFGPGAWDRRHAGRLACVGRAARLRDLRRTPVPPRAEPRRRGGDGGA